MISCKDFYGLLKENGLTFFAGVPDSLLKNFCACLCDNANEMITANEGNAISVALGYHLATGKIGVCYMQNSGLGNATNPLASLVHPEVYSVPMLLIIGWRGEPGKRDEPQHVAQGKITLSMLDILGIAYEVLPESVEEAREVVNGANEYMQTNKAPYALVVKEGTFDKYEQEKTIASDYDLNREEALRLIVPLLGKTDIIVATTGKLSRELFELRNALNESHGRDFLTVGGMGHASSIALGLAMQKPDNAVYCLDGDGALIMHMGSIAIIGSQGPANFKHIVMNNGAHDSVGGQPTAGFNIDIAAIARACGYREAFTARTRDEVTLMATKLKETVGAVLLEIRINKGARQDLGRPTTSPLQNKREFMSSIRDY